MASDEPDLVQNERMEDLLSVGITTHFTDSTSSNPMSQSHAISESSSSLLNFSEKIPRNNLRDFRPGVCDHKLGGQFQLISTKPFQNTLCAQHNVEDSAELLNTKSDPDLQIGVYAGVGLVQPVQVNHDESSRGLRRVGQLPLRKLKIAREKRKEEAQQKRKDAKDKAIRMLVTEKGNEPTGDLNTEGKEKAKSERKVPDNPKECLLNLVEKDTEDAAEEGAQDGQQKETEIVLENQLQNEYEERDEPSIQLGLSYMVPRPMNLGLLRFTHGQRKVIAMIDQMMEELNMIWLGPSAWCEIP